MITVCLYGSLQTYGRRFDLHVETPAEAVRALASQFDGFLQDLRNGHFQVRFNRKDYCEESLRESFSDYGEGILHIVPRTQGAGRFGQIVAGVVIAVVAWYAGPAGWGLIGSQMSGALVSAGIGMALGGVAQLLAKTPKLDSKQGAAASQNSSFSNLDNTTAQGSPMPIAYGKCYCGSRIMSQGLESRRLNFIEVPAKNIPDGSTSPVAAEPKEYSTLPMLNHKNASGKVLETPGDPETKDISLNVVKTFTQGVAATAPNGQKYNTDFSNDSVRAQNYTAKFKEGK